MKTDLRDLRLTVETIRRDSYSHLDREFLSAIVSAEDQNPDDNEEALRTIREALALSLSRQGAK